ncbi:MAG: RHS repeat-associated core domain-containing protein, partial [Bacteroidales bacterium]|nr:RHS repeat-associated core domain-containing protein [Bacteroidales bacterium]
IIDEPIEEALTTTTDYVHGRLTGEAERILGEEMTNEFKWSTYYYDRKGHIIQTHTTRAQGGVDVTSTSVTFTGNPLSVCISHDYGSRSAYAEFYAYTYDNWDRPLTVKHLLDREGIAPAWTTLSDIQYDAAGRIVSDVRNGNPELQTSFTYNVRSWKTGITGPGFSEELSYEPDANHPAQISAREEWGGNITAVNVEYGAAAEATSYHHEYGYDALSRLISASTVQGPGNDASCQEDYAYDDHTNLVNYNRTGAGLKLKTFSYSGNRMTSVSLTSGTSGARGTVSYDDMGRITSSTIEGMTEVKYNVVGYPSYVRQADGGYVHHTYTAGGARLASRRVIPGDVDEVTLMEYEGNEVRENGQLRMLLFDGGYVDFSGSEPRYCWHTTDHLGSVRAVADSLGNVFASYAYRPYGEEFVVGNLACDNSPAEDQQTVHEGEIGTGKPHPIEGGLTEHYSANASSDWQPYRFSGKESLTRVGLDLYDFGARMYSPSNMRWMTMDPLCEKFYDISPYVYCNGNPMNLVDPDGRNPFALYELLKWGVLGAAAYFSTGVAVEYACNRDYGAGKRWQDQQDGKARDDYNRRRINMQNSINNNFPNNSDPNQEPNWNGHNPSLWTLLHAIPSVRELIQVYNSLKEMISPQNEQDKTEEDDSSNSDEANNASDANNASNTSSTNNAGTFPVLHPDEKPNNTNQGETKKTK